MVADVAHATGVLVVGGGIGGLGAALALRRVGADVLLAEQAPAFGEVGAGLQLGPNATRILDSWGLLEKAKAVGVAPRRLVLRDAQSGADLATLGIDERFLDKYSAPYLVIHRTDLHTILLDACRDAGVELLTDTRITSVTQGVEGTVAHAEDGRRFEAEVTLGADGIHSLLRQQLVGDDVVPSGFVAYRGTVPISEVPQERSLDDVVLWITPGAHMIQYRLRGGTVLNIVAVFRSPGFGRGKEVYGEPEELAEAFADCLPRVRDIVALVGRQRRWALFDREPAPYWGEGRLVLTGDAAHPMLQYLAQGACQALEDANTLEMLLREEQRGKVDWPRVVRRFTEARIPRTAQVQTNARFFGEVMHNGGVVRILRNALLERSPDVSTYLDWLYADTVTARLESSRSLLLG